MSIPWCPRFFSYSRNYFGKIIHYVQSKKWYDYNTIILLILYYIKIFNIFLRLYEILNIMTQEITFEEFWSYMEIDSFFGLIVITYI